MAVHKHRPSVEAVADRFKATQARQESEAMERDSAAVADELEELREANHFADLIAQLIAGNR